MIRHKNPVTMCHHSTFVPLFVVSLLYMLCTPSSAKMQVVSLFPPTQPSRDTVSVNFTHITVDPNSGSVYLGATNWLYQLNLNLTLDFAVRTGPVQDSPNCSPTDCSGVDDSTLRLINNTNKVLVVDPSSRMLIVCGSIHQGSCRRHVLTDIRKTEPLTGVPVAANDENSSTIAFVGLAKYYGVSYVLYVAASNSKLGPYRELVPAISSRSLEPGPRLFSIIEKSFQDTARVDISYHLRDYFIVKYIYGFQSGDHVYFAMVQKKSHFQALEEWGHVSRLARVCSSDAGFHTYTEMTISCIGVDGTDYSILQDATVGKVGALLGKSMGLGENDEVFIGTFATPQDHSLTPSGSSAVCIFPLADIERAFMENIHLCFNGSVSSRNMDYIAGSMNECPESRKSQNIVNFCHEPLKLNGTLPLWTTPVAVFPNVTVTSVATSTNRHQTFAFLGTSSGSLKQLDIMSPTSAEEVDEIPIDPGHPILEDISHDPSGKFIFVLSPYRVAKVRIDGLQETTTVQQQQLLSPRQFSSLVGNTTQYRITSIAPGVRDDTTQPIQQQSRKHSPRIINHTLPAWLTTTEKPHNRRDHQLQGSPTSTSKMSPIVVSLLAALIFGVFMVAILVSITFMKRKVAGTFARHGVNHHHLYSSSSDSASQDFKFPPPLISTANKHLPLIPLPIGRDNTIDKHLERGTLSPTDSQVNAIYCEINELNIGGGGRRIDDDVLISSPSTTGTTSTYEHLHPLISHHSSRHMVNQLSREAYGSRHFQTLSPFQTPNRYTPGGHSVTGRDSTFEIFKSGKNSSTLVPSTQQPFIIFNSKDPRYH